MVSKGALHVAALLILGLLGACRSFPMLIHAFREIFWYGDSGAGAILVHLSAKQSCRQHGKHAVAIVTWCVYAGLLVVSWRRPVTGA